MHDNCIVVMFVKHLLNILKHLWVKRLNIRYLLQKNSAGRAVDNRLKEQKLIEDHSLFSVSQGHQYVNEADLMHGDSLGLCLTALNHLTSDARMMLSQVWEIFHKS